MSEQTEQVIKREVYEVGMTVRLRNGITETIIKRVEGTRWPIESEDACWCESGRSSSGQTEDRWDIIGEVVTAPAPKVATVLSAVVNRKRPDMMIMDDPQAPQVATKAKREVEVVVRYGDDAYTDDCANGMTPEYITEEIANMISEREIVNAKIAKYRLHLRRYKRDAKHYGWEV
jgi:hypothetical protein